MNRYPLWAVLAPGDPSWLKRRAFAALELEEDEEDDDGPPFAVSQGSGRYHAIVGLDEWRVGVEIRIAELLSFECSDTVYSIERATEPWTVMLFRNGASRVEDMDPETLAKSLGCPLPGSKKPPGSPTRKPLRTVVRIEGIGKQEVQRLLEEIVGEPLNPGSYVLEEVPQGLLLASGTERLGFAYIKLSERLPHVAMFVVTASPSRDIFFATLIRGGEGIEGLAYPPREFSPMPSVSEIKGERSPGKILAALGIPADWFSND